jgi:hypothetical protein
MDVGKEKEVKWCEGRDLYKKRGNKSIMRESDGFAWV